MTTPLPLRLSAARPKSAKPAERAKRAGSIAFAAFAFLVAGSALCACDTGYNFSSGSRGPGSIGTGGSTASTGPAATVASAPLCLATALAAKGGRRQDPNDAGGAIGDVIITNSTASPCELKGDPAIELLTTAGHSLGVETAHPLASALPPVVLAALGHSTGELVFTWQNWCGGAPGALEMHIVLAGGGSFLAPLDGQLGTYVPTCSRPGTPSTLRVQYAYVNAGSAKPSNA
jgi:hypothetical protein